MKKTAKRATSRPVPSHEKRFATAPPLLTEIATSPRASLTPMPGALLVNPV
ncbi:MAG: hypothetical protein IPN69_01930 [Acidobacteria bacterium]|nr:hypothetical protein [Acidobacteriota bacterium]